MFGTCVKSVLYLWNIKLITMANRLKTNEEKQLEHYAKMQKEYAKDSLGMGWFFAIITVALLLIAFIENL